MVPALFRRFVVSTCHVAALFFMFGRKSFSHSDCLQKVARVFNCVPQGIFGSVSFLAPVGSSSSKADPINGQNSPLSRVVSPPTLNNRCSFPARR